LEGSFTLEKGEEQNVDGWQERLLQMQEHTRPTASSSSRSSTVIADDVESDDSVNQPSAEVGMSSRPLVYSHHHYQCLLQSNAYFIIWLHLVLSRAK